MERRLTVGAWLRVEDGCAIELRLDCQDYIDALFGDRKDGFEFTFTAEVLRRFTTAAQLAIDESDRRRAIDVDDSERWMVTA